MNILLTHAVLWHFVSLLFIQSSVCLEAEFLEEVVASCGLLLASDILLVEVPVVKEFLKSLLHIHLLFWVGQIGLLDNLLEVHVDRVPGGKDVTDIHVLDKGLHGSRPLFHLLL
mmetsp:Transcript_16649/g.30287  ORF Transcript_16649/g.30287 Transcript_16649/m.30287 type:complete len:114 (+) Transcript_16649:50-391(+)